MTRGWSDGPIHHGSGQIKRCLTHGVASASAYQLIRAMRVCGILRPADASALLPFLDGSAGSPPLSFTLAEDAEDAGKGCKAVYKAAEAATAAGQSCAQCGKTAVEAKLRRCSACPSALYCSIACASARWPAHKAECRWKKAERVAARQLRPGASQ